MGELWTGRRRAIWYFFGGIAEVTDVGSGNRLVSETSELSRLGCFVKTTDPFLPGTVLDIKITHEKRSFVARGAVVHLLDQGMGIAFGVVSPSDQTVLNGWLPNGRTNFVVAIRHRLEVIAANLGPVFRKPRFHIRLQVIESFRPAVDFLLPFQCLRKQVFVRTAD
jgi:hypothetical protein